MKTDGMNDMGFGATGPPAKPKPSGMAPGELCVPLSALAMPDEGDQLANPEEGDKVTLQVEGKVGRIEGENAYITPETVNGQPVSKEAEPDAGDQGENSEQDYADLQEMAGKTQLR
jgi:hypothetical protein